MKIHLFCEGQTEINIVKHFADLVNPEIKGKGKAQVNNEMISILAPKLPEGMSVRALVMRDVDDGETAVSILQSVTRAAKILIKRDFSETEKAVQFTPHAEYPNVYLLSLTIPDLRLALHLAADKWDDDFINATIDDYVLKLALRETTTNAFLSKRRKKGWAMVEPEQIARKVTDHISTLLQENGIPLREAKDYVRLYAAVIQGHTSPTVFAQKTLANASDEDKKRVFASLLAALQFLGGVK